MKLRLSITLLFTVLVTITSAQNYVQDFNYSVGKPYRVVDASSKHYFSRGDEMMAIKLGNKQTTIQKFDNRSLVFVKQNDYDDFPKGASLENIREVNDHYYLFFSLWDSGAETEQLYYREIDFASGTFMGAARRLIAVNGKITGTTVVSGFYSFEVVDKFTFESSFDKSKLLIQYRKKPDVRDDSKSYDIIGLCVFDDDLNEISREEVTMPYTEKKMNNLDYSIDGEGNTYILSMVYDDNTTQIKKSRKGPANYHIELLRITVGTNSIRKTPIRIGDRFISEIAMFESGDDRMLCAGYYSNGRDIDDVNGVFMFKVAKEGEVENIKYYEIPVAVLNMYISKGAQKKNEKADAKDKADFDELKLRRLVASSDGSITLMGEQYYVVQHTQTTSSGTRTYYTYHYNDMLLTKINPDGSLGWMQKLPKRQTGKNGKGGMGVFYTFNGDAQAHYLLFLDNAKNKALDLNKIPAGHSDGAGGFLTAYKVDHNSGKVSKTYLFDMRDVKGIPVYQFNVGRIIPVRNDEFVVEVYKKKKEDILIKITTKQE